MIHILVGILSASIFYCLIWLNERRNRNFTILLIISLLAEVLLIAFVAELILGFLLEGTYKGALLMGLIFGFPTIAAGLIIYRWIFIKPSKPLSDETG